MFDTPFPLDRTLTEGVVTEIDIKRSVCKVKTLFGKTLTGVRWILKNGGSGRSGDRESPQMGDNCVISYGLGYPLIIGYLSKLQIDEEGRPSSLCDGIVPDTGNFTSGASYDSMVDINKPSDMVVGDKVFQTFGGGLLALLRGGSILLRSNRFSEIFLSKYSNLVRIVSGNWEHFTDVCSDVIKNYRGRVFRYVGYTNTYQKAKSEAYNYHEYMGDTALAEYLKTNYNRDTTPPAANTIIKKEQVIDLGTVGATETMRRTISLDGTDEVVISGLSGSTPIFTRVKQNNGTFYVSFNDTSFIQIDTTAIVINRNNTTKTTHDATGVHIVENGGSSVDLNNGVITAKDSANATAVLSGGNITLTDSQGAIIKSNAGDITLHSKGSGKVDLVGANVILTDGVGSTITMSGGTIVLHSQMGGTVAIAAATAVS